MIDRAVSLWRIRNQHAAPCRHCEQIHSHITIDCQPLLVGPGEEHVVATYLAYGALEEVPARELAAEVQRLPTLVVEGDERRDRYVEFNPQSAQVLWQRQEVT